MLSHFQICTPQPLYWLHGGDTKEKTFWQGMLSFKEKLEPKPCTKHALDTPWPHQPFRALKPTCWFSQTLWSPCIFKVLVKPNTPKKHGDLVVDYPLSHCLVVLQHFLSLVPQICLSNTNPSPPLWSRRERCKPVGVQITFCQGNKLCKPFPFGKGMASSKKGYPLPQPAIHGPFCQGSKGPFRQGPPVAAGCSSSCWFWKNFCLPML